VNQITIEGEIMRTRFLVLLSIVGLVMLAPAGRAQAGNAPKEADKTKVVQNSAASTNAARNTGKKRDDWEAKSAHNAAGDKGDDGGDKGGDKGPKGLVGKNLSLQNSAARANSARNAAGDKGDDGADKGGDKGPKGRVGKNPNLQNNAARARAGQVKANQNANQRDQH
jgi:hypothetical protein